MRTRLSGLDHVECFKCGEPITFEDLEVKVEPAAGMANLLYIIAEHLDCGAVYNDFVSLSDMIPIYPEDEEAEDES